MVYDFSYKVSSFKTQIFKCLMFCFCLISITCFSQEILSFDKQMELRKLTFSEDSLFTPEQLQEDFRYYCKIILETHPNPYYVISKEIFDAKVENILKSLDKPMNRRKFWLKIATLNACFDGHTNIEKISEVYDPNSKLILPFNLLMLDSLENLYFNPKYRDSLLAGKYIKSINDISAKQIIDTISAYYSHENKNMLPIEFLYTSSLIYRNLFDNIDSIRIEYVIDNEINVHTFYPWKPSTNTASSTQTKQETEKKKVVRFHIYEEESIAIIEIDNFITELLGENYRKDLEKMMSAIVEKNIKHLFINISLNGGGDSDNALEILNFIKTDKKKYNVDTSEIRISPVSCKHKKLDCKDFASFIKKHKKQLYETPDGKIMMKEDYYWTKNNSKIQYSQNVYLIQSEYSFSATVDLSSVVKAYKIATIIGSETGGLTSCYIDAPTLVMPNTLIPFRCSVQKCINVGGKWDGRGVFPDVEYKIVNSSKSFTLEQLKEMLELVGEYKKQ